MVNCREHRAGLLALPQGLPGWSAGDSFLTRSTGMRRPQRRRWAGTPVGQPPSSGGTWGGRPGVETRRRGWVGRRSAGSPYSSPWPASNPAQVGFSNRGLGPLRTRSVHGQYWPSPGHTPGWAPVSSKLRGRGGGVPRIPSEWCILGQRLNSDPVPVARGTHGLGWLASPGPSCAQP